MPLHPEGLSCHNARSDTDGYTAGPVIKTDPAV